MQKINQDNCLVIIEEFCDEYGNMVPVRANSYVAADLMVKYLTEHEYLDDYCIEELMDMAHMCLVESVA